MAPSNAPCLLCRYVRECEEGTNFRRVAEFEHSWLTVGEHRFFEGYCVLVFKRHVRDLHELSPEESAAFWAETMRATEATVRAFGPSKMNHASYGNAQPHLHWHLFPRYAEDPDRTQSPWKHQDRFEQFPTTPEYAEEVRRRLVPNL